MLHHEPRAAGVFTPGFAPGTLANVSLSRSPSFETLMRQDTLELGKVDEENPTPNRLEMTPHSVGKSVVSVPSPETPTPTLPESQTLPDHPRVPLAPANDGSDPPAAPVAKAVEHVPLTVQPSPTQHEAAGDTQTAGHQAAGDTQTAGWGPQHVCRWG